MSLGQIWTRHRNNVVRWSLCVGIQEREWGGMKTSMKNEDKDTYRNYIYKDENMEMDYTVFQKILTEK